MLGVFDRGVSCPNILERMMKYAYHVVSLEAFSLDSVVD